MFIFKPCIVIVSSYSLARPFTRELVSAHNSDICPFCLSFFIFVTEITIVYEEHIYNGPFIPLKLKSDGARFDKMCIKLEVPKSSTKRLAPKILTLHTVVLLANQVINRSVAEFTLSFELKNVYNYRKCSIS